VDSTVVGHSILRNMPKGIVVNQSSDITRALSSHIAMNHSRRFSGYRVRIYFDNQQNSRGASEAVESRFAAMYPGIATYRTYQAPFFKVTVGDFRTHAEAAALVRAIKKSFPTAFIVKREDTFPDNRKRGFVRSQGTSKGQSSPNYATKQELTLKQQQKLSPLQIQTIKLIELPVQELEQRIRKELEENPVLDDTPQEKDDDDTPVTCPSPR